MDTLFKNTRHPFFVLLVYIQILIVLYTGIANFSVDSFILTLVPFYTYNSKLYMVSLTQYYNYGKNQSPSLGNLVETTSPFYVYVFPR
jgi:Na+/H+ antiporter NhaC